MRSGAFGGPKRDAILADAADWDLIIIGGGITGAGILREAVRSGLRVLLLEQQDFAAGTSSRSSKLVHGGLRYLKYGQVGLTRASVLAREGLRESAPGLVEPLGFLFATTMNNRLERLLLRAGLTVYDLLAGRWSHRFYSAHETWLLAPHVQPEGFSGAFHYGDAQADDARLVLRLLQEAVADGAAALNYVEVVDLLREGDNVTGVVAVDQVGGARCALRAAAVVNATGAWVDRLREKVGGAPRLRPLRGSHLVFPHWRLPVAQAVSFAHPTDERPVMVIPWEGVTLVGTTDVDHAGDLAAPRATPEEVGYLLAGVAAFFPRLQLTLGDLIATFAGVRPVVGTGKADPSAESREHVIWQEHGLLSVTGGKLTTFQLIAHHALEELELALPRLAERPRRAPAYNRVTANPVAISAERARRLTGRYGARAPALVATALADELQPIPQTRTLWAELRWAARHEGVVTLDDLLLRRVRIGLQLPGGGRRWEPRLRAICQEELGWDDIRWTAEWNAYCARWEASYGVPQRAIAPVPVDPVPSESNWRRAASAVAALTLGALWVLLRRRAGVAQ